MPVTHRTATVPTLTVTDPRLAQTLRRHTTHLRLGERFAGFAGFAQLTAFLEDGPLCVVTVTNDLPEGWELAVRLDGALIVHDERGEYALAVQTSEETDLAVRLSYPADAGMVAYPVLELSGRHMAEAWPTECATLLTVADDAFIDTLTEDEEDELVAEGVLTLTKEDGLSAGLVCAGARLPGLATAEGVVTDIYPTDDADWLDLFEVRKHLIVDQLGRLQLFGPIPTL